MDKSSNDAELFDGLVKTINKCTLKTSNTDLEQLLGKLSIFDRKNLCPADIKRLNDSRSKIYDLRITAVNRNLKRKIWSSSIIIFFAVISIFLGLLQLINELIKNWK